MADVVVVGGGPAGSAAALTLARAGIEVTLVERAAFPRRKVCGEYLNAGALDALDALGLRNAVSPLGNRLRGIRLVPPAANAVTLPFPSAALACAREALDALLLDAAVAAGVRVERARVEGVISGADGARGIRVRDADGVRDIAARYVVGADGCGSIVARDAGLTRPSTGTQRYAVGGHYAGFGSLDGYVEMFVGAGAYFALNPLGDERTNVMVVVPKRSLARWSRDVDEGIAGAAAALGRGARSFAQAHRLGARVAVGPLAHRVAAPIAPGVVLVGDAAGFLNPFTGQGVAMALASGTRGAAAIVASLADPARSAERMRAYATWRRSDFDARKRLGGLVSLLIDIAPLARRAVAKLDAAPERAAALIAALTGLRPPQTALSPLALARLIL